MYNMILFWFSRGSLNPIVLFEYGKWLMNLRPSKEALDYEKRCDSNRQYNPDLIISEYFGKPIFVGIDPEYQRKRDVEIQTSLEHDIVFKQIVYSLGDLANQIIHFLEVLDQLTKNIENGVEWEGDEIEDW